MCCPMATCWWPRATSPPHRPTGAQGHQGLGHEDDDEARRRRCSQRQPHHLAARCRWRRRCRDRSVFLESLNSPFGMALVGSDLYVANADAIVRFPYRDGANAITARRRQSDRSAGRRSTITGPRTSSPAATAASSMRPWAPTAMSAENGMEAEEGRAAIWEIDRATGAEAPVRHRPAQPQRHGLGAEDRRALDGGERTRRARQRPRARLPDLGEGGRASMAGHTATGASMSTSGSKPQRPDLVAKAAHAGLRAGRARRSAGPGVLRRNAPARAASQTASSSASTAPGTASRSAATR